MKQVKYANEEITIIWQPELCQHFTACFKQMPEVFNPAIRKWINPKGTSSDRIIEQIKKCPSGALSYSKNEKNENQ